jgi:hypothetical protein
MMAGPIHQGDDLAVDDSFIGHGSQRLNDGRIPGVEILVVARPEVDSAAALDRLGAEAVELNSSYTHNPP